MPAACIKPGRLGRQRHDVFAETVDGREERGKGKGALREALAGSAVLADYFVRSLERQKITEKEKEGKEVRNMQTREAARECE